MIRFLIKRAFLGLVTLALLSLIVFFAAQILPGDTARRVLGPFADQTAIEAFNRRFGYDQPVAVQYWHWITGILHGDLGTSLRDGRPVADIVVTALGHSLILGAFGFALAVPIGILGGTYAAMHRESWRDRSISIAGLSVAVVPEFVWAITLLMIFALGMRLFPVTAQAPDGAGIVQRLGYLFLPAVCLVFPLFGYFSRMMRSGAIEALGSDYVRAAVLRGLPQRTVLFGHVMRNALLPTIAAIANQIGYLIGGIVAVEVIFNYQGIGLALLRASQQKDFPVLQATVLLIGAVYVISTLTADLLYSALDPRVRLSANSSGHTARRQIRRAGIAT